MTTETKAAAEVVERGRGDGAAGRLSEAVRAKGAAALLRRNIKCPPLRAASVPPETRDC